MVDPEALERIAARRAELDGLEEQLVKQLVKVRAERDELAVAEQVLTRMNEQSTGERAVGAPTSAQVGGRPVLLVPHRRDSQDVSKPVDLLAKGCPVLKGCLVWRLRPYAVRMSSRLSVAVCPGREIAYPAALQRLAGMGGIPLVCFECKCGATHLVVVSPDGAEVVASGGGYLRARFELLGWVRSTVFAEGGAFRHYMVPDADRSLLDGFLALLAARVPGT
ncbi:MULTISPECIES: hypothetical protein [Kitasatospora]|uniref:Uncharacterized protein n=1 Tax=Kitasatospora cathayae TaxID=3004092 RepID=A0ABY7PWY2_9ACTN|nr:hypothetical protein [Kitasatospora sp. HUAS 3-15]WBP84945.1 hypothetical protein O1G21_03170 [Kitasatospora sp. HUAS 3-15]